MVAGLSVIAADVDGRVTTAAGVDALTAVALAAEIGAEETRQPLPRDAGAGAYAAGRRQMRGDSIFTAGVQIDIEIAEDGGHLLQDSGLGVLRRIFESDPDPARTVLHFGVEIDKTGNALPDSQAGGGGGDHGHLVEVVLDCGSGSAAKKTDRIKAPDKNLRPKPLHQLLELLQAIV